jgi:hypothetical protein
MTETVLATVNVGTAVEAALAMGDLSKLTTEGRISYYNAVCKSMGLNPLTRPLEYITLNNKLTLYARRDATDQLRKLNGVSVGIIKTERLEDVYVVTAEARMGDRVDTSTGAVSIGNLKGEMLANALMKAETKAKRRVTLSIVGLGFLDETEIETIADARPVTTPRPAQIAAPTDAQLAATAAAAPEVAYTAAPTANQWITDDGQRKFFWKKVRELGYTPEEAHLTLGVEKMGQWAGTMNAAIDALEAAKQAVEEPEAVSA